ncbi:ATP-binding cassette domain-containing protein [Oenococcus sp. UCMA 17063]|nr:ATP-binding cassette domain-containing protein [Oenococcus sp. UCMA 17063]
MKFNIKYVKYGSFIALKDISFELENGQITALVGRNGAGKSSLINAVLGLTDNVEGSIPSLDNINRDENFLNKIGYIPEIRSVDDGRSVKKQIVFQASLKGVKKSTIIKKIPYWLNKFSVVGDEKTYLKKMSKGNQQKIQIIAGIIHQPDILIFDEPFSGLDPINTQALYETIKEFRSQGTAILISSHNMQALEEIADKILLIKKGKQVFYGTGDELKKIAPYREVKLSIDAKEYDELRKLRVVKKANYDLRKKTGIFYFDDKRSVDYFARYFTSNNYLTNFFDATGPSLETIFKELA